MHEDFHFTPSLVHFIGRLLARRTACDLSVSACLVDSTALQDRRLNPGSGVQAHRRNRDVSIQSLVAQQLTERLNREVYEICFRISLTFMR